MFVRVLSGALIVGAHIAMCASPGLPQDVGPRGDSSQRVQNAETKPSEKKPYGFVEQLRSMSRQIGSSLTPNHLAHALGSTLRRSGESAWIAEFSATSNVMVGAPSPDAPAAWVKFRFSADFGLRMSDLEALYGSQFRAIENTKHGTDIFFRPPAVSAVPEGVYVAAKLWTRRVMPDSAVSQLNWRMRSNTPASTATHR